METLPLLLSPTIYSSAAYSFGAAVNVNPVSILLASGFNPSTDTAYWLQFFNTTAVPANGSVPSYVIYVPASSQFSWSPSIPFKRFSTGLSWCVSTTGPTKTIATAPALGFWLDIEYVRNSL